MLKKNVLILLLLMSWVIAFGDETKTQQASEQIRPLRDGFALFAIDGKVVAGEEGKFFFQNEIELSDGRAVLEEGQKTEILKTSNLEKYLKSQKNGTGLIRIWGNCTEFKNKNYIYISYFLPLAADEEKDAPAESAEGKHPEADTPQDEGDKEDEGILPEDVLEKLRPKKFVDVKKLKSDMLKLEDVVIVDRFAYVKKSADKYYLCLDALGQNVEKLFFELLETEALENTIGVVESRALPVRFKIAGIATQYKGEPKLLLQRAARVYSNGNFPR